MIFKHFIKNVKYGLRAVLVLLIILSGISYGADTPSGDADYNSYISELISKSKELKLADDPYWHIILHYKKNITGGFTSQVDDPAFFFAKKGKHNPEAELEETIRSFFRHRENVVMHPNTYPIHNSNNTLIYRIVPLVFVGLTTIVGNVLPRYSHF